MMDSCECRPRRAGEPEIEPPMVAALQARAERARGFRSLRANISSFWLDYPAYGEEVGQVTPLRAGNTRYRTRENSPAPRPADSHHPGPVRCGHEYDALP